MVLTFLLNPFYLFFFIEVNIKPKHKLDANLNLTDRRRPERAEEGESAGLCCSTNARSNFPSPSVLGVCEFRVEEGSI